MAINGIDVSAYQPNIDWNKVKNAGIQFVIIRAGYGKGNIDKWFKSHIEGALSVGLQVGAYWFIYALNEADLVANAKAFSNALAPYKERLSLGMWCDWEGDTDAYANRNGVTFDKATRTAWVKQFNRILAEDGYNPGVYANPDYLNNKLGDLSEYPLWLALYGSSKGSRTPYMWQYSSRGSVDGIKGNVDMNYLYNEIVPAPSVYRIANPTLRKGDAGEEVKVLQNNLNKFGYNLTEDGLFGDGTETALRGWQLAVFLGDKSEADGVFGLKSHNKMVECLG